MTNEQLQETVEVISRLTDKSEQEVHDFVKNNTVKYSDLREFAFMTGQFPSEKECALIGNFGIASISVS